MSDEEFEDDEPELDDDDLDEDAIVEDDDLEEETDDIEILDDDLEVSPEVPVAVVTDETTGESTDEEDDEEGVVDLDEELHPDDVEEPLDVLLQERTASATLEDDEEELEEEEADGDDRADGPAVSCRDVPTSSSANRASSCCRSAVSPTLNGSTATTALDRMTPAAPVSSRPATALRAKPSWARLGAALGAGVVTGLCFPPVGLGPVVLVAVVPLLWAWRGARPAHAALYGFAYGVAAYTVVIPWIRYFGYVAIVPLVVTMALAIAAVGALVAAYARRGLASPFLTAAVWVVLEALRGRFPFGGFPWADLGVALHDVAAARAVASVGGTLLVSFAVVTVNGLLLDLGLALRERSNGSAVLAGIAVAGVLVATIVADVTRFEPTTTGHLRVAMLQGDDEQLPLAQQVDQPLTEQHFALADRLRGHYDLIVFPEAALDTDPERDSDLRSRIVALARKHDSAVLVNARTPANDGRYRNTNLLYTPDGKLQGTYSKQHLVPFGEYVPWRDALSWLPELRQVPYDFEAGRTRTLFRTAGHRFESVICFESAFAPLVRAAVRDGAEIVVVSTNNRSYQRSANSEQHVALGQMRAAETGRAVLQASVSGITAVIDPDGSVHHETGLFESAVVTASVPTSSGETLYVRFGDWVVLLGAVAMIVVTIVAIRRPVRSPAT